MTDSKVKMHACMVWIVAGGWLLVLVAAVAIFGRKERHMTRDDWQVRHNAAKAQFEALPPSSRAELEGSIAHAYNLDADVRLLRHATDRVLAGATGADRADGPCVVMLARIQDEKAKALRQKVESVRALYPFAADYPGLPD